MTVVHDGGAGLGAGWLGALAARNRRQNYTALDDGHFTKFHENMLLRAERIKLVNQLT